jgi:hypothetical protein
MHKHPVGVAIILSDCDFKFNLPQDKSQNVVGTRGQVIGFDEPFEHLPENLSTKPFEGLFVEVKESA